MHTNRHSPLEDVAPDVPVPIARVVDRALERNIEIRYGTASAFGHALACVAAESFGTDWLADAGVLVREVSAILRRPMPDNIDVPADTTLSLVSPRRAAVSTRFARRASRHERKVVSVLSMELVSPATSEADPEDFHALMEVHRERLRTTIQAFGGTMERFVGDAAIAILALRPPTRTTPSERCGLQCRSSRTLTRVISGLESRPASRLRRGKRLWLRLTVPSQANRSSRAMWSALPSRCTGSHHAAGIPPQTNAACNQGRDRLRDLVGTGR